MDESMLIIMPLIELNLAYINRPSVRKVYQQIIGKGCFAFIASVPQGSF